MTTLTPTRRPQEVPEGRDPEALIEEARRRARRRRAIVAAAVLIAVGAALGAFFASGGGGGSGQRPAGGDGAAAAGARELREIAHAARRNTIVEAGLVAPDRGWAMNGLALWSTENGGHTWRAITPPPVLKIGDPVARIDDIQFVGRRRAWVAASDIWGRRVLPDGSLRHFEIERTTDGGKTWHSVIPPGCAVCGGGHLSFLDARRGYLLTGASPVWLYSTGDGGATWQRIARAPFSGAIVFLDPRNAFGATDPGGALYRTRDGGRRWHRVRLDGPRQYRGEPANVSLPRFFGDGLGVMPVRFRDPATHGQHLTVYVTRDGGSTWTPQPAPDVDLRALSWGYSGGIPFSASSPDDWILLAGKTLYSTSNAGRSWRAIRLHYAPALPRITDVAFMSPTNGWAIFSVPQGAALVHTTNGGRDWTPLVPPRVKFRRG
jgi:photosystem II stability/assembly factor-like uncharacterized protein